MTTLTKRFILIGLAFILGTGMLPSTNGNADTRTIDTNAAKDTTKYEVIQIEAVHVPYTIIVDGQGRTTHVPWFNGAQPVYQRDEMSDGSAGGLSTGFVDDETYTSFLSKINPTPAEEIGAQGMWQIVGAKRVITNGETLAEFRIELFAPEIDVPKASIEQEAEEAYIYSWLFKLAARQSLGLVDYPTAKKVYSNQIRPKIKEYDFKQLSAYDAFFDNEKDFNESMSQLLQMRSDVHLNYSPKELTHLNPDDTARRMRAILGRSVKEFITTQADGTLQADGLTALIEGTPFLFSFDSEAPAATTTATTSKPVTVHYVDDHGETLKPDKTLTGSLGSSYKTEAMSIANYTLTAITGQERGSFTDSAQTITYTYTKDVVDRVPKNSIIYATKKLRLYTSPTFTTSARQQTYAKKSRMNRPMFQVIDVTASKNGVKRYHVRDLNGLGKTGYLTAKADYTAPLYYAKKQKWVTVINPRGLNAYETKNLTGGRVHYKQGRMLKVKRIVSHNLTMRFMLSNGRYISANKKLVIGRKMTMPKRVVAKTALNRYGTVNLTKQRQHYAKKSHANFTVKGWAYSNVHDFSKGDTLRYKVAGGYISGNQRFVEVVK